MTLMFLLNIVHFLLIMKQFSRDQNFGINDLAAIQDVRNEFSLQDIDESAASKDRGNTFIYSYLNTSKNSSLSKTQIFKVTSDN